MYARRVASAAGAVLALVVVASCVLGLVPARRAEADTAYRYWAFYIANGATWNYSSRGPAAEHPADGEVQGWRFAVQLDRTGELAPRTTPTFDQLCASTPAVSGKLRVGLVLDFGTAADAPTGETRPAQIVNGCVQVASGASGADVLLAAVGAGHVRVGSTGLVCGIDGYPKTECAPAVDISRTTQTPTPTTAPTTTAKATPAATHGDSTPTPTESTATQAKSSVPSELSSTAQVTSDSGASPSTAASDPQSVSGSVLPLSSLKTQKSSTSHGFPLAAVAGALLVLGLGAAAFVKTRR